MLRFHAGPCQPCEARSEKVGVAEAGAVPSSDGRQKRLMPEAAYEWSSRCPRKRARGLCPWGRAALASAPPSSGAKALAWGEGKPILKGRKASSSPTLGASAPAGLRLHPWRAVMANKQRATSASHPAQGLAPYPSHTPR